MTSRIFLLLLLTISSLANAQKKEEIKELFWGKNDAYKAVVAIPDKWKRESAVVIYKNENYDFHKFGQNVTYVSSVRKRIKLMDQAAVTEFSEFAFNERFRSTKGFSWKGGTTVLGIKIVKPDGKEREINVTEEAVAMDEGKKVAISGLEVGDIIDFYYHFTEEFKSKFEFGFTPVETTLGDEYPIMDMKLSFKTENDFFVNFNTYNGAPPLKDVTPAKSSTRFYELTAKDIEKNDFPRWFYPLVELPCYKFQVYFARSGKFEERAAAFLPEKESIIKKEVSKEDVLKYYENIFVPLGDLGDIKRYLKKKTYTSDEEKVRDVYYFTRHYYYTRYVEAFVVKEAEIMEPFLLYGLNPVYFNHEAQFIRHFMAFLKDNKLEYDIIVSTARYNGPIEDLLLVKNATVMLKVNTATPVYLEFFTPYINADQIADELEGTQAYSLKVSKGKKVIDVETVKLPVSTYQDNNSVDLTDVTLSDDFSSLTVNRESKLTGHNKEYEQRDKMYFFNYVDEDYTRYGTERLMDLVSSKKKREQYTKEFDALKNKLKDKQKEEFKKSTEQDYGFAIDDHSFIIVNAGRFGKKDPFTYTEKFTVKDNLIKRAGSNYVLEVGKLLGSQAEIEDKEAGRTNNIYSVFPRQYDESITVTIPQGYTVTGLDKLNKNVVNATGGFISSAKIEGDKLIVTARKYYINYYEPNSNWKSMIAFLDAAYQFTQEKVLLKKI